MFQMINEEKSPDDSKLFWVKAGLVVAGLALMGGVVYFFALVPFHK